MESDTSVTVSLGEGLDLGLIVKLPTSVVYSNQADGVACQHPATEGVFIPLDSTTASANQNHRALEEYFESRPGNRGHLGVEDAEFIDAFLRTTYINFNKMIFTAVVDRAKLVESFEAWVHLELTPIKGEPAYPESPLGGHTYPLGGVLVWPNSD